MLDAIKALTEHAATKKFTQSGALLNQLGQYFELIEGSIQGTPFEVYAKGALNDVAFMLEHPSMTDEVAAKQIADMARALQITQQLVALMIAHSQTPIKDHQRKQYDKFIAQDKKLRDAILEEQKGLSFNAILELNQRLAKILKEIYGEKNLPTFAPAPAPASIPPSPKPSHAQSNNDSKLRFLDALSNLFKGMASPEGPSQGAVQSFVGVMVEFVVGVLGNFFKAFLGKEAAPKVDELVGHAGSALQKMFASPEVKRGTSAGFTPGFDAEKGKQREKATQEETEGLSLKPKHKKHISV